MKLRKKEKPQPFTPQEKPIKGAFDIEPHEVPAIRIATAIGNKSDKELAFVVGGGLGDRVCAEPTLRFALEYFKGVNISLICETPQLFRHLNFKEIFDLKNTHPIVGRHLYMHTYSTSPLQNQFMNPNLISCVDMCSLSALRMQLPVDFKKICLETFHPEEIKDERLFKVVEPPHVLLHLGKSWPSRTFPSKWWNDIIDQVLEYELIPVLIGNNCVEVEVKPGVVDLRDQLTLDEFIYVCFNTDAIITNDSSPLHLASAGWGSIAFVSTCRRGDLLMHHRFRGVGWRMKDFACDRTYQGKMWQKFNILPNNLDLHTMKEVPAGNVIEDYLPDPRNVVDWIKYNKDYEEEEYDV